MKKIMIYPFDRCSSLMVKHIQLSGEYHIEKLVSLKGWSCMQSYVSEGREIQVTEDYEDGLNFSDIVCVVESWIDIPFDQYIFPRVSQALEKGKTVYFTKPISKKEKAALLQIPQKQGQLIFPIDVGPKFARFVELSTPILAVGGYSQGMDKLEIQFSLTQEFRKQGYKSLLVASNPVASILGEHYLPSFLFQNELTENDKVRAFNYYIAELESRENPDIIILGIPGAVVANDAENLFDFGVLAFEMSLAVPIDDLIVLSPYQRYPQEYFAKLEELIVGRLGVSVIAHHLSKYTYDLSTLRQMKHKTSLTVDENMVEDMVRTIKEPKLFNLYQPLQIESICKKIINKYNKYGDVVKA